MPINKLYPLSLLIKEIEEYSKFLNKEVFIQYTMFHGINDDPSHAQNLLKLLKDIPCKINLIPFNQTQHSTFKTPNISKLKIFQDILIKGKIRTMIRFSKGKDIQAACGQLIK